MIVEVSYHSSYGYRGDTATALRQHPMESVFGAMATLFAVLITGAPVWLILLYQFMSLLFSRFNDANISPPAWIDCQLRFVIVSHNMHKIHHHHAQPLTEANDGKVFSLWDRLSEPLPLSRIR